MELETAKKDEEKCTVLEGKMPKRKDDEGGGREEIRENGGENKDPNKDTNSSMMLGLLDEFSKIYADRLQRVEDTAMKSDVKEYLERKVSVLEGWVHDLGEQNAVLVVTVEELEREAATRVALLEDRLANMASTTRQSCLSLRDHQMQVSSLVHDKVGLEKETEDLGEKIHGLEKRNIILMEENDNLHSDLKNLIQLITCARETGQWDTDDFTFLCISPDQVFGPVISASRRSSQSLKEGLSDYLAHPIEDQGFKKGGSSITSSVSNLQECESSCYVGRGSEKDLMIMKLRADIHNLQSAQEQANRQLLERDKQIADLQIQLTQVQEELSRKKSDQANTRLNHTEISHHNKKCLFEGDLNDNIDTLATQLREVEDECFALRDTNKNLRDTNRSLQDKHRDLYASHTSCSSTITSLQDQVIRAEKTQDELRNVLTAEVAERHDRIVRLGDELKAQEQQHHETKMQLQLKLEVIKELRKELRGLREGHTTPDHSKSDVSEKDGEEPKSSDSHIDEIYSHPGKIKPLEEDSNKVSRDDVSINSIQETKISKLENEVAEKSVLLRELQNHLAASRQELHLKDETLYKLEQKLDKSRQAGGEKGERMQYLTGQLTSLQLEVGRTHGQAEKLRREVENKTELVLKLESENSSLTQQLNEKSNTLERLQNQLLSQSTELDKKKKEVTEQRLTISALQDALVSSKRACDQLRCRLHPEAQGREGEKEKLQKDLQEAQSLHHQTFSQLVESGAQQDFLREENQALSQRLFALQENYGHKGEYQWKIQVDDSNIKLMQAIKERDRASWEKEDLTRQLRDAEQQQDELLTSLRLLQGQIQVLEEELTSASEGRAEAERRMKDAEKREKEAERKVKDAERRHKETERTNRHLHDRLSLQERSESVECLGQQLEAAVSALTAAQEDARVKGEQLHRAHQDAQQLSGALACEKGLNASLHDQVEGLMRELAGQEGKVGELQKEVRRLVREASHREKQGRTNEVEAEGLRRQIGVLEGLLEEGQRELTGLRDALSSQDTIAKGTRTKLQMARKEASKAQDEASELKMQLREAHENISSLELKIKHLDEEREAEVNEVVERLTASHEQSVRRLEASLITYSRVYGHGHHQVEGLEESLAEVGERLREAEHKLREACEERETLGSSLRQERVRQQEEAKEHHHQILRLNEEISLLKARLENVQEESSMWQRQCEDLEERHSLLDATSSTTSTSSLVAQMTKMQHQMDSLKEAVRTAREEKRTAEEERGHAHEQVLSLIRECNALEEQIHRLTKEKCRLEEKVSAQQADLTMAHTSKEGKALHEEQMDTYIQKTKTTKNDCKDEEAVGAVKQEHKMQQHCGEMCRSQREASEARRLLIEKDTQAKLTQLKITTLQKSLQDHQSEVSVLEERLQDEQTQGQRREAEVAGLRTQVATLSAQLSHAQARSSHLQPTAHTLEALENEILDLKGELAAREEQLKQADERYEQELKKTNALQQEVAKLSKIRDDALQQVAVLETAMTETQKGVEDSQALKMVWDTQLSSIKEEVARLMCETGQLKDCNAALHDQLSGCQNECEALRNQLRGRNVQLDDLQQARDLLAKDAQVVVAAVRQWLHEQRLTNTKLAGKLHQQNKQILLLNTEKQFLAERNTSLQRTTNDLGLQVHDLRARLGLPPSPSGPEKLEKIGGVMMMGSNVTSPRVMSPSLSVSPRMFPSTPTTSDTFAHIFPGTTTSEHVGSISTMHDTKLDDVISTCSSEGSLGCQVPGPDLSGTHKLDHLAQLADSLLAASRNIGKASTRSNLISTNSLGDLHYSKERPSLLGNSKNTSLSVGNLNSFNLPDVKDRATSPMSAPGDCEGKTSRIKALSSTPVRERKTRRSLLSGHSIEEEQEEEDGKSDT